MAAFSPNFLDLELEFTKAMVEEWCKSLGVVELRASSDHSFLGDISGEPTDETVAALFEPISMVLAQFGTQVPNGSKIKAAFLHVNEMHALWPAATLQKELASWAEHQGATFRAHCTYMVRLWRKTKTRSKNVQVQQLKDILNDKYGISSGSTSSLDSALAAADAAPVAAEGSDPAPAEGSDPAGAAPEGAGEAAVVAAPEVEGAGEEVEGEVVAAPEVEGAGEEVEGEETSGGGELVSNSLDASVACGPPVNVDQMETLPFSVSEANVPEEWPPCPWIPKSSLDRWSWKKAKSSSMTAHPVQEFAAECSGHAHEDDHAPDASAEPTREPEVAAIDSTSVLQQTTQDEEATASSNGPEHVAGEVVAIDLPEPCQEEAEHHDAPPALESMEQEVQDPENNAELEDKAAADHPMELCEEPDAGKFAPKEEDLKQLNKTPADVDPAPSRRSKARAASPGDGDSTAATHGSKGRGRGRGRGKGKGKGKGKRSDKAKESGRSKGSGKARGKQPKLKDDDDDDDHEESPQPKRRAPASAPSASSQPKSKAKKGDKPKTPHVTGPEEEEAIKATLPSLEHYKVVCYWTTGNVGVEMKAHMGMKKREVAFISRSTAPGAPMGKLVEICSQLATDLQKGEPLAGAMKTFYDSRNQLTQSFESSEDPKPKKRTRVAKGNKDQ